MQCFRTINNRSPPQSQSPSPSIRLKSLSIDSLNKYYSNTINRKSFVRRSFEIVRKNVLRQSHHLLRRNSVKVRKLFKRNEQNHNDPNNNRSSYDESQFRNQRFSNTHSSDGDDGGGGVFVTSTDADILTATANDRGQICSKVR